MERIAEGSRAGIRARSRLSDGFLPTDKNNGVRILTPLPFEN